MNETIWHNFFDKVHKGDTLYFLGDLTFKKPVAYNFFQTMKANNIQVHFIFGNHDRGIRGIIHDKAAWCGDLKLISVNNMELVLSHYAMRVWPKSHFNSGNLYAHSHGTLPPEGKQWDVGVDNNNFFPISADEVKSFMSQRPDNFNLVKN
ncbi:hypothetical protein CL614_00410 [archaeon]|nr:hypothetical protein [archaeon]